MKVLLLSLATIFLFSCNPVSTGSMLKITDLGPAYQMNDKTLIAQMESDQGGNTSIRNNSSEHLVWKSKGYYQRNRDLGQVFTLNESHALSAIILRTGPGDKAILPGAVGAEMFLQFYDLDGVPTINDNNTPPGTPAKHGFSSNHRCDDFIEGLTYNHLVYYDGGLLPQLSPTFNDNGETGNNDSKLTYLRFELDPSLELEPGQYAFMVGFTTPGKMRGMTLANANRANLDEPPSVNDEFDLYGGGWGLRREGNGEIPAMLEVSEEPTDLKIKNTLLRESLFPDINMRLAIDPTSDGYPDVDTYRDLTFAIEVK